MIKCFLDCESSGVDAYNDRIVQITLRRVDDDGSESEVFSSLVNPGIPIPADSTAIHGIHDEDVAEAPTFEQIHEDVERLVDDAVLIGYNSRSFDVPLIHAELLRAGRPGFPLDEHGGIDVQEIDLYKVWLQKERRDLTTAAKRFAGIDHTDDAHDSAADVAVLEGIMAGMRGEFDIDSMDDLMLLTAPEDEVDRDGKFKKNGEGKMVFNFGKHGPKGGEPGKPVSRNISYVEWMLGAEFSPETKAWCKRFIEWS